MHRLATPSTVFVPCSLCRLQPVFPSLSSTIFTTISICRLASHHLWTTILRRTPKLTLSLFCLVVLLTVQQDQVDPARQAVVDSVQNAFMEFDPEKKGVVPVRVHICLFLSSTTQSRRFLPLTLFYPLIATRSHSFPRDVAISNHLTALPRAPGLKHHVFDLSLPRLLFWVKFPIGIEFRYLKLPTSLEFPYCSTDQFGISLFETNSIWLK